MDGSFGDDVGVETVAEVDRVDIVTIIAQESLAFTQPQVPLHDAIANPFERNSEDAKRSK